MEITARVYRDGDWWAVEVPINGTLQGTQGKTLAEAQFMADDLVKMWAEELADEALAHAEVTLTVDGDVKKAVDAVKTAAAQAEAAREVARDAQVRAVSALRADGLTMQDIATVLGVTKGRVSQLAHA